MKKYLITIASLLVLAALFLGACSAKSDKVTVATDATFPPFETVDETTKELTGFDIDLMNAIADKAGFEIEWVNTPFDSILSGLSECQYDMGISAISYSDLRAESMLFTQDYMDAGQIVAVRIDETAIKSKDDLSGKTVAAQLGTTGEIEAQAIPDVNYKPYDSYDLAMLDLMNGQVDAVIGDKPTMDSFIGQYSDKLMTVGETFTSETYAIALCKDKTDLQSKVNEALDALKADGTIDQLSAKYLAASDQQ